MDEVRAKAMAKALDGTQVGGWTLGKLIGAGKSALVLEASHEGQVAALKIFDPELVERFGEESQLARIGRECLLIGESHENLVKVLDGGKCPKTGYLFVAMEHIRAPNLADSLTLVPREKISEIVSQVALAAKFLESKELAHRDIKPENIAILPDFSRAVLLDLGVIRPFGEPGLTDEDQRVFIGTLRYSSPEYLVRDEHDVPDGWRAITFYQIGAVLHDLIMRKPLFHEFSNPYAVLVEAVKSETPEIFASDLPERLVLLAKKCLVKKPEARLKLVSWDDFDVGKEDQDTRNSVRERVKQRQALRRVEISLDSPQVTEAEVFDSFRDRIENIVRHECASSQAFPPFEVVRANGVLRLDFEFSQSESCALGLPISFVFEGELIDLGSRSFVVRASFCTGKVSTLNFEDRIRVTAFKGPVVSENFSSSVSDLLWTGLDNAQKFLETECIPSWLCLELIERSSNE